MEMLGSRKPTLRNLKAASEAEVSSPRSATYGTSSLRLYRGADGNKLLPETHSCTVTKTTAATTQREASASSQQSWTRLPHTSVLSPVRVGAHMILRVTPDLYVRHQKPFYIDKFQGICRFCRNWISNSDIYIYKGEMGFCKPECRNEYIQEATYKKRQKPLAIASTSALAPAPAPKRFRWAKPKGGVKFFI